MGEELRRLQDAIQHAIRNLKLDPKTFDKEILDDLDLATRCFSAHIDSIKERLRAGDYQGVLRDLQGIGFMGI